MKILVSRCLLGEPCRYDGQSVPLPALDLVREEGHTLVPVCPEQLGGLKTPRAPAEIQLDGSVVNQAGEDVTAAYLKGADRTLALAKREGCTLAILKAKSPSCGSCKIYDGSFSGTLVPGWGIAACLLAEAGIVVVDETQLNTARLTPRPKDRNPSKAVR